MPDIESPSNPAIKAAARLRSGRVRRREQRFVIDGQRELAQAVDADIDVDEVFVGPGDVALTTQTRECLLALEQRGVRIRSVARAAFEKLIYGQRQDGVVAVARVPHRSLSDLPEPSGQMSDSTRKAPLIVVLEGIEKPGNVGAVCRTADAAGATALIVANPSTDLFNPNTIRASLGAVFTVPACCCTSDEARQWLLDRHVQPVATRVDAKDLYWSAELSGPVAIVLGSEADGLSDAWRHERVRPVRLPMTGRVDSLNVSVTASVLLYEALRQRAAL